MLSKSAKNPNSCRLLLPQLKEAYDNMGDIFSGLNQTDKAEEMYNQALRIDPDYLLPQAKMAYLRKDISKPHRTTRTF
jgi:Tfp pilus assembly protein PilF